MPTLKLRYYKEDSHDPGNWMWGDDYFACHKRAKSFGFPEALNGAEVEVEVQGGFFPGSTRATLVFEDDDAYIRLGEAKETLGIYTALQNLLADYEGEAYFKVLGQPEADPVATDVSYETPMTVGQLVEFLKRMPQEATLSLEGCDCFGEAHGAELSSQNEVSILRRA